VRLDTVAFLLLVVVVRTPSYGDLDLGCANRKLHSETLGLALDIGTAC
jgi:hypothetical protein